MLPVWTGPSSGRCKGESSVACILRYHPVLEAAALSCKTSGPFALSDWTRISFKRNKEKYSLYHLRELAENESSQSASAQSLPRRLVHSSCRPGVGVSQIQNLLPVWKRGYYFKGLWQFAAAVFRQNLKHKKRKGNFKHVSINKNTAVIQAMCTNSPSARYNMHD